MAHTVTTVISPLVGSGPPDERRNLVATGSNIVWPFSIPPDTNAASLNNTTVPLLNATVVYKSFTSGTIDLIDAQGQSIANAILVPTGTELSLTADLTITGPLPVGSIINVVYSGNSTPYSLTISWEATRNLTSIILNTAPRVGLRISNEALQATFINPLLDGEIVGVSLTGINTNGAPLAIKVGSTPASDDLFLAEISETGREYNSFPVTKLGSPTTETLSLSNPPDVSATSSALSILATASEGTTILSFSPNIPDFPISGRSAITCIFAHPGNLGALVEVKYIVTIPENNARYNILVESRDEEVYARINDVGGSKSSQTLTLSIEREDIVGLTVLQVRIVQVGEDEISFNGINPSNLYLKHLLLTDGVARKSTKK